MGIKKKSSAPGIRQKYEVKMTKIQAQKDEELQIAYEAFNTNLVGKIIPSLDKYNYDGIEAYKKLGNLCQKYIIEFKKNLEEDINDKKEHASRKTIESYTRYLWLLNRLFEIQDERNQDRDKKSKTLDYIALQLERGTLEHEIEEHAYLFMKSKVVYKFFYRPHSTEPEQEFSRNHLYDTLKALSKGIDMLAENSFEEETEPDIDFNLQILYSYYRKLSGQCPLIGPLLAQLEDRIIKVRDISDLNKIAYNANIQQYVYESLALGQIMNFAVSENANGNPDYVAEILKPSEKDGGLTPLYHIVSELATEYKKSDILPENANMPGFIRKFADLISDENAFFTRLDDKNKDIDTRIRLNGYEAVTKELSGRLNVLNFEGRQFNESLRESLTDTIHMLKNDAGISMDRSGKITDQYLYWICRLISVRQMILQREQNRIPDMTRAEYDLRIARLTSILVKSKNIQAALQDENIHKNKDHLFELLAHTDRYAKCLNELPYVKRVIDSPEQDPEFKKQAEQIQFEIADQEEERIRYLNEFKDGYYNIGLKSYRETKKQLNDLGSGLASLADEKNPVFAKMKQVDGEVKKNLGTLYRGMNEVSGLLKSQSEKYYTDQNSDEVWGFNQQDEKDIKSITEKLDEMIENCEFLMLYVVSDLPEFQNIYQGILDTRQMLDNMTRGNLIVPDSGQEYENGKQIKRIVCLDGTPDTQLDKEIKTLASKAHRREKDKGAFSAVSSDLRWQGAHMPLFSHDPCPDDIVQGNLGDCYLVATLLAVAARNPQSIRDMMSYNEKDNTVTVRFYDPANNPVYVTVSNTVPAVVSHLVNGKKKNSPLLSEGARWVTIFEKALIASGLINEYDISERNPDKVSIKGGHSYFVMNMLFGPEIGEYHERAVVSQKVFNLLPGNEKIFPEQYAREDLEFYEKLKGLFEDGHPLTCNTPVDSEERADRGVDSSGLVNKHEYGIVGFVQEDGVRYIYVKNPHASGHRDYNEENDPVAGRGFMRGLSKIELRDFLNNFESVVTADFNKKPIEESRKILVEKYRILYRETIQDMELILRSVKAKNERGILALRTLSGKLLAALDDKKTEPDELRQTLRQYFEEASKYLEYRDNLKRGSGHEKTMDRANCYFAASVIQKLGLRFRENEMFGVDQASKIEVEALREEALTPGEHDSNAKRATCEILTELRAKKQRKTEQERNKIRTKIDELYTKSEGKLVKAMQRPKGKDPGETPLIEALSEYVFVLGLKDNANNLGVEVIRQKLRSENLKRVKNENREFLIWLQHDKKEEFARLHDCPDVKKLVSDLKKLAESHRMEILNQPKQEEHPQNQNPNPEEKTGEQRLYVAQPHSIIM